VDDENRIICFNRVQLTTVFFIFIRISNVILITWSLNGLGNGNRNRPTASAKQFCGKIFISKKNDKCLRHIIIIIIIIIMSVTNDQKFRPIMCLNITGEIAAR